MWGGIPRDGMHAETKKQKQKQKNSSPPAMPMCIHTNTPQKNKANTTRDSSARGPGPPTGHVDTTRDIGLCCVGFFFLRWFPGCF